MRNSVKLALSLLWLLSVTSCDLEESETAGILRTGTIQNIKLDEASGIQAGRLNEGVFFLHNDDGKPEIFAIDQQGSNLGSFLINGAINRDWEDISMVPSESGPLLVVADSGDNFARFKSIRLNFFHEPPADANGRFSGAYPLMHSINLQYPDGPRDCESIAFDPSDGRIYVLSKRDKPARIYTISLHGALALDSAVLQYEGDVAVLRRPTSADMRRFGPREVKWISQPTGMDISPDGKQAAIITYRSLYLFRRQDNENWVSALARKPVEFFVPSSRTTEAVSFTSDGAAIMATAEGVQAPVYRFRLLAETD